MSTTRGSLRPSRRLRRIGSILVLAVALSTTTQGRAQETPPSTGLQERLDRAIADERWDDALAHADTLAFERQTHHLATLQEIVRLHCRKGDVEAAYAALDDLLEAGYWNFRALRQDEGLDLIRNDDRFVSAIRASWSKQYIGMLERDSRDAMQLPERIMTTLQFQRGERVADIGAGSGYFTLPIARAVGPDGMVVATDIRQEMLDHIAARLGDQEITNVELRKVEGDDPGLDPSSVDTIFMVDVYHYIEDRIAYAKKLRTCLAPGGRLIVIDFRYDPDAVREFAPPLEQQVACDALDADLAAAGFRVRESHDFLPEQYFVVYELD